MHSMVTTVVLSVACAKTANLVLTQSECHQMISNFTRFTVVPTSQIYYSGKEKREACMIVARAYLLLLTLWFVSSSPLNSQRHQRVHAGGGSYLAKVSSSANKKERTMIPSAIIPSSESLDKRDRTGVTNNMVSSPVQRNAYVPPPRRIPPVSSPKYVPSQFSLPVVDIFFIFADMPKLAFVQSQYFWVLPSVAAMLVKTAKSSQAVDSEVRVHILSDTIEVLEKASSLGFYSYDLVPHIDKHTRFLNKVARTVNSTAGELGFFRWKVLNHIVTDWNSHGAESPIRRVIALNGEVLLTVNAAELFDRAVKLSQQSAAAGHQLVSVPPEAIYLADSIMLYSPQGLNAFDAYIDEWFNNAKRDELRRKSVGTHNRPWSDIILFEHFANTSTPTSLRVKWFDSAVAVDASTDKREQRYVEALGCEPLPYYNNPYGVHVRVNGQRYQLRNQPQRSQVPQDPRIHDIHIAGPEKQYPYCFMSFVDRHVKNVMYVYGRALEILRGGEEAHTHTASNSLSGDMLLTPEKSREVYYIHSNGTRYFIANKEEFTRLFLAREQVIGRVPMGLIEAFRPLAIAFPWAEGELVSFGNSRAVYYVDKGCVLREMGNPRILRRFNLTMNDVKTYKDYSGPIIDSIPFGPKID